MNKRGQINPKTIIFTLGGGFLGFILFNSAEAAIIGGIIGLAASFLT